MTFLIRSFNFIVGIVFISNSVFGQSKSVTISGAIKEKSTNAAIPYANVVLMASLDSHFVAGTVTDDAGRFTLSGIKSGDYFLSISSLGYKNVNQNFYIGQLSDYLNITTIELIPASLALGEIEIMAKQDEVNNKLDKKTYSLENIINQSGGSILQSIQNLPGVTVQEGKIYLRGNDNVMVLIDNKQTAITGFGNQSGLDNISSSNIDKIEIINNPSSKYDANGNAGIINIVMKKANQDGWSGKIGMSAGLGALWIRKENLPTIRPQYQATPKLSPSISLNYRKKDINLFVQADDLYTQTLNKNEFVERTYDNNTIIQQQLKRNRNTNFLNTKTGIDWNINSQNTLTISGYYGSEKIIDRGDQPFFDQGLKERFRLWQFLEDELKTTVMATGAYQHKFSQAGHLLNIGFNYTFHRENEKYFFDNIYTSYTGHDAFKLISDEHVSDFNVDYIKPLKYGRVETGMKLRIRDIPTNMQFFPGIMSPIDSNAGGPATYSEIIPAIYGNYVFENKNIEAEIGIRLEYVDLSYKVNPNHNTYNSDGYSYTQPFPNIRFAYKLDDNHKLSLFFNRRVDRPNEVDIRIFPKYDDAEIIKVGNPGLAPQFTNSIELGYKSTSSSGYMYAAAYHKFAEGTITRISTIVNNSPIIYAIFQNAGKSFNSGMEIILSHNTKKYATTLNINGYQNQINAFTVQNKYPILHTFSAAKEKIVSGNLKWNTTYHFDHKVDAQLTFSYLAPDIIPQGKIAARYAVDMGIKKAVQSGKGELILNATDLFNTMIIKKNILGNGFKYTSTDYYETQVIRLVYSYKI